jgi:predicted S18 family serine protease
MKAKDLLPERLKKSEITEVDKKSLDKASKIVSYLVKYYGLKVQSARQAVSDLARFI